MRASRVYRRALAPRRSLDTIESKRSRSSRHLRGAGQSIIDEPVSLALAEQNKARILAGQCCVEKFARQHPSRAIVVGKCRARARNLQDHVEAREKFPQWCLPTRGTAGLFRRGKPREARRDSSFCAKRCRNETLLARRNRDDAEGIVGTASDNCCLHRSAPGRAGCLTWDSYQPAQDEESLGWLNVTRSLDPCA